jgi:hypothetical protein
VNPATPNLTVTPSTLTFTGTQGGANPTAQTFSITNSGGGTLTWTATKTAAWLGLSTNSGSGNATVNVTVDLAQVTTPGTYNDTITVTGAGATRTIAVTFTVQSNSSTGILIVTPATFGLNTTVNNPPPSGFPVEIRNTGTGTLNWRISSNQPWVTFFANTGVAPGFAIVSANPIGLPAGTHTAIVTVESVPAGAAGSPQQLTFNLNIQPTAVLFLSPTSLTFTGLAGGANPAAQRLVIGNSGGGRLDFTVERSHPWISVSQLSGIWDAAPLVEVNTAGLPPGTHQASLTVRCGPTVQNAPLTLPITVILTEPAPSSLDVRPSALDFSALAQAPAPAMEEIGVINRGDLPLNWTAAASHPWIQLNATSGTAPSMLGVRIQEGLAPGDYSGTVTITGGSIGSPKVVPVVARVFPSPGSGRVFYAAPSGSPSGNGSLANPWNLSTAIFFNYGLQPGDTIYLRQGRYVSPLGYFNVNVGGSATQPIVIRSYPGEVAVVEGGFISTGANIWFWDLEVVGRLDQNRQQSLGMTAGFSLNGQASRVINCIIHDNLEGVELWSSAPGSEAYGNVIFNNGYESGLRGHGHGIYSQNTTGTMSVQDNFLFHQYGWGFHAFATSTFVRGYHLAGNISFNNGVLVTGRPRNDNYLFDGGVLMESIRVEQNHSYHTPEVNSGSNIFSNGDTHRDLIFRRNIFAGGAFQTAKFSQWEDIDLRLNTFYNLAGAQVSLLTPDTSLPALYHWNQNAYFGNDLFRRQTSLTYNFSDWKRVTGRDSLSTFTAGRPSGMWITVRPNKYERNRANIVIYNWGLAAAAQVDLTGVLALGTNYEVRNAQDWNTGPILTGIYSGGAVTFPLTGLTAAPALGLNIVNQPLSAAPEFAVFVIRQR